MKRILSLITLSFISFIGFSQTKGISYQAVIIDPNPIEIPGKDVTGQPYVSKDVWIRFGIYAGTTLQFEELHKTKTDEYGLVNLIIGGGVNTGKAGTFPSLNWDGVTKSILTNVSFDQGANYKEVSNQRFAYVPYSFLAETAVKFAGVLPVSQGGTGATNAADARANLGLDKVDNTSDLAKPISSATKAVLDLKANSAEVNSIFALKANTSDMTAALAAKADTGAIKTFVLTKIASATISDADATTKGKIKLAGDLGGTADVPTVPGLVLKENSSNKSTNVTSDGASDTKYPSVKAVKTYVDAQVSGATIADATASIKGKIQLTGDLSGTASSPTVPGLALKLDANQKGVANGVASLNAQGIIPSSQLPPVTFSSTNVVASDAAMIAIANATVGSIAVRTDVNKNYVLSALPASTLGNWVELLTPGAPVQSVNGYLGSISLSKADLGLSEVNNTSDNNKPVSNATQSALDLKANITDVNSALATKISTADVTAALALKANSADVTTTLATKISTADATVALALKLDANKVGVATGVASLDGLGKVPTDQIPAISFSSVNVLKSEAEMLALNAAVIGSVVIRTDENKNYVLAQSNPAIRSNWIQLLTPAAPVQTVNGKTGTVSLSAVDFGLGNVENTSDANKPVSSATQTELDKKVDKVTGKSLSTNDYTTAEKTKLAAITGTNTGDQDLSAYVTNTALALKANIASPTFTGIVTTSSLNTGALSSTSVTTPVYASTPINLSYAGSTINWNPIQGLNAAITLTQNSTLAFTNMPVSGSNGTLVITQDATGNRTLTLPTTTNRILGSTSTTSVPLSTSPSSRDILNFYYDGTAFYWNIGQGYGQNMISATTNLQLGVSGTLQVSNGGTGATSITGLVKGTGTSAMTNAVAGVDYVTPTGSAASFTNFPIFNQNTTGNAATATLAANATKLATPRTINGVAFDGTADISITPTIDAGTLSGTTLASNVVNSSLTSVGTLTNLTVTNPIAGSITGNASTATLAANATKLATPRTINGVAFDGTADISITPTIDAGTLSGTTLASNVVNSSLTSVGTITSGTWSGTSVAIANGGTGATTAVAARTNLGLGNVENTALSTWAGSSNITTAGSLVAQSKTFWLQDLILGFGDPNGAKIQTDASKYISFYPRYGVESTRMWPSGNVTIQTGGTFTDNGFNLDVQGSAMAKSYKMTVPATITASASTTIDLSTGNMFKVNLTTNITSLSFLFSTSPGTYIFQFIQDGTGNKTVTFPASWKWSGGSAPTVTATANKIDIVTVIYDGSTYFASIVQNF
jgi:hypothetical protein